MPKALAVRLRYLSVRNMALRNTLRLVGIACAAVVVLSFAMFAMDELGKGSDRQVEKVDAAGTGTADTRTADPVAATERRRERENGPVREAVDDANDLLLKPFADVADSTDVWVARGVPALIGVLLYGLLLVMLSLSLPTRL